MKIKILVIGASRGIGLKTANLLSRCQCHEVIGVGRSPLASSSFGYIQGDIVDQHTIDNLPPAEVIIYCAGKAFDDVDGESYLHSKNIFQNFELNCFGFVRVVERFLRMGGPRHFIYVSSMSTIRENHAYRIGYSASKLATNKMIENLKMQYRNTHQFSIVNFGRIHNKPHSLIGVSYDEGASILAKIALKKNGGVYNIPKIQYALTMLSKRIPAFIYKRLMGLGGGSNAAAEGLVDPIGVGKNNWKRNQGDDEHGDQRSF
jgi:hypothetical protein